MHESPINLDNCAREPIHIPGAIQPHGLLFVLDKDGLFILQVSENTLEFFGMPPEELLGQQLEVLLDAAQVDAVRFALNSSDPRESNPVRLRLQPRFVDHELDGLVHRHDGFSFLELEPAQPMVQDSFVKFYQAVSTATSRLQGALTLNGLFEAAATEFRRITEFDRVMIYRFAANDDGQVVAESKTERAESFLGLWYPASDIPEQARRMYALSPIRCIARVPYKQVALAPAINPVSQRPTDLTYASLRSLSPIHCEYLMNMGVAASMSISLVRDGKLWGLVACHHKTPRFAAYELRKSCTFLGQVLSGEIVRREHEEESVGAARTNTVHARFLELMAGANDPLAVLLNSSPNLLDLIPAAGAAVVSGDNVQTLGVTPDYADLLQILDFLRRTAPPTTFATSSLKNHFSIAERMTRTASGLLALEISRNPRRYVLYFRPEVRQTMVWPAIRTSPSSARTMATASAPASRSRPGKRSCRAPRRPGPPANCAPPKTCSVLSLPLPSRRAGRRKGRKRPAKQPRSNQSASINVLLRSSPP